MALSVRIDGVGDPIKAAEAFLIRALGEAEEWRFIVEVIRDTRGDDTAVKVAAALGGGVTKASVAWAGVGGGMSSPPATLVGARWLSGLEQSDVREMEGIDRLLLTARRTAPKKSPDAFVPRRRVHKCQNMLELVDRFAHIATPMKRLRSELEGVVFPDKDRACIVQDSVSDWDFFAHIMDQCRFLASPSEPWLPLCLFGSVDEGGGTAGGWVLAPGARSAYEQWGETSGRRKVVFDPEADNYEQIEFAQMDSGVRTPELASGLVPNAVYCRPTRRFDAARWERWRTTDVPLFYGAGAALVWRAEDRLYEVQGDTLRWATRLFATPPESRFRGPVDFYRLRPWVGQGVVQETSPRGPWIKVKLEGFEPGEDVVDIRLCTPFSGTDQKKGLHYVPEKGTKAQCCWSGRFDASVTLVGNTRWEETDFASPSIYLEAEHTAQFADVHVKKVGKVTVDSDYVMGVKQETRLNSTRQLKVNADGADLKMSGGIVYTGRG